MFAVGVREIRGICCQNPARRGTAKGNGSVPDILVRNIDDALAERIKTIARERGWSINEVIVHVLRHSLGFGGEDVARREIHDVAELRGTWNPGESAAFRKALEAFEKVEGTPLFADPKKTSQAPK